MPLYHGLKHNSPSLYQPLIIANFLFFWLLLPTSKIPILSDNFKTITQYPKWKLPHALFGFNTNEMAAKTHSDTQHHETSLQISTVHFSFHYPKEYNITSEHSIPNLISRIFVNMLNSFNPSTSRKLSCFTTIKTWLVTLALHCPFLSSLVQERACFFIPWHLEAFGNRPCQTDNANKLITFIFTLCLSKSSHIWLFPLHIISFQFYYFKHWLYFVQIPTTDLLAIADQIALKAHHFICLKLLLDSNTSSNSKVSIFREQLILRPSLTT